MMFLQFKNQFPSPKNSSKSVIRGTLQTNLRRNESYLTFKSLGFGF